MLIVQCTLSASEVTEYVNNALVLERDNATAFKNGKKNYNSNILNA